jgi:uncharacterized protein (DUF885 family)
MNEDMTPTRALSLDSIAHQIFDQLARQFPVCMASDEFHFFPQARSDHCDWSRWDDFSVDTIREVTCRLSEWDQRLQDYEMKKPALDDAIDAGILRHIIRTIDEQLKDVTTHQSQPTFYLTILGIGLAEAVDAGPPALNERTKGVPEFIDQATGNLRKIPRIFRDMGLEMLQGFKPWFRSLNLPGSLLSKAMESLQRFNDHLHHIPTCEEFLPPVELFEQIAFHHMDCRLNMDEISTQLDQEISETRGVLEKYVEEISPGRSWQEVIRRLPLPDCPQGGAKKLYQSTISDLAGHCVAKGLVAPDLVVHCPVSVEYVPDHLLPVRSNAAFSMPPGHPPQGGTFFIMKEDYGKRVPSDWRLLTAHETFPGHHLLDTSRWNSDRPVRRHIEFPIYYEGWACFSEELLFDTGFFTDQIDHMLLAKRRFWRAMRGRVDIDIHTRKRNLKQAVHFLCEHGMPQDRAAGMVRRYILKPGYQLAYTIGRRKFRRLYEKSRDPVSFAHRVLSQGEIGFDHLEKVLERGG